MLEPQSTDFLGHQHSAKKLSPKITLHFKVLCDSKATLPKLDFFGFYPTVQDNITPTKKSFSLDDAFRSAITDSFKQRLEDLRFFSENLNDFETSEIFAATRGR